ncbi:MAG: hypothetical protein AAGA43_15795 [Bacteroidota bacterium]
MIYLISFFAIISVIGLLLLFSLQRQIRKSDYIIVKINKKLFKIFVNHGNDYIPVSQSKLLGPFRKLEFVDRIMDNFPTYQRADYELDLFLRKYKIKRSTWLK